MKYPSPHQKSLKAKLFNLSIYTLCFILLSLCLALISPILLKGLPQLSFDYLITNPSDSGRNGGIASILVSTILIVSLSLIIAIPLGLSSALFLFQNQKNSQLQKVLQISLDTLASTPSIVFGLFGYAFFGISLNLGYSILTGALTLSLMILPLFTRTAKNAFDEIDKSHYQNAHSLNLSQWTQICKITLPLSLQPLIVGLLLSVGRAFSETAALIFTSGYVDRMPSSVLDSGRSLSIHIYDLSMNVTGGESKAYLAASTLILLLLTINTALYFINAYFQKRRIS